MKRLPYTQFPAAWDRAQRTGQDQAEAAYAIQRFGRASSMFGAIFKFIVVLVVVVAAVHVVAKVWPL